MRVVILLVVVATLPGCETHRIAATTKAGEREVISPEIYRETEAREAQNRAETGKKDNWVMDAVVRAATSGLGNLE